MSDHKFNNNLNNDNIQSGIVNIGGSQTFQGNVTITMSNLSATIGAMNAAQDEKAALQKLIEELKSALKQAPPTQQVDAEKSAKRAKEAVEEAVAANPEKDAVEMKVDLLKKAVENVAGVMPAVVPIAMNIVAHLLKMGM